MVKLSGGSRRLKGGSLEYNRREIAFQQLMNSGKYSYGYFSQKGGGYVLIEKSSVRHKPEEFRQSSPCSKMPGATTASSSKTSWVAVR